MLCHVVINQQRRWTVNCRHDRNSELIGQAYGMSISEIGDAYDFTGYIPDWIPVHESKHRTLQNAQAYLDF